MNEEWGYSSRSSHGNRMTVPKYLVSGVTAVFWKNLNSNGPPLLCDGKHKAQRASYPMSPYHKRLNFNQLNLLGFNILLSFYNMKRRIRRKSNKKISYEGTYRKKIFLHYWFWFNKSHWHTGPWFDINRLENKWRNACIVRKIVLSLQCSKSKRYGKEKNNWKDWIDRKRNRLDNGNSELQKLLSKRLSRDQMVHRKALQWTDGRSGKWDLKTKASPITERFIKI